jgi:hypothetical protein
MLADQLDYVVGVDPHPDNRPRRDSHRLTVLSPEPRAPPIPQKRQKEGQEEGNARAAAGHSREFVRVWSIPIPPQPGSLPSPGPHRLAVQVAALSRP